MLFLLIAIPLFILSTAFLGPVILDTIKFWRQP